MGGILVCVDGNGIYDTWACRCLGVRLLWDAVIDYVRGLGEVHEDAASFLHSSGGRFLFDSLDIDADSALDHLRQRRAEFRQLVILAFLEPKYEEELKEWWKEFHGQGFG